MEEEEVVKYLFPECKETAYDDPDSHWYLEGWCQDKRYHFYNSTIRDYEHNDSPVVLGATRKKHAFIAPTEPLVWGENASRFNICPRFKFAEDDYYHSGEPIEECSCPCHWSNYYVNVYETTQAYGGPEEGGWYFTCGTPYEAMKCDTFAEAKELLHKLWDKYKVEDRNYRYTDVRYSVHLEDHFAEPFPTHRPHYE